jgi:hypothetical protein
MRSAVQHHRPPAAIPRGVGIAQIDDRCGAVVLVTPGIDDEHARGVRLPLHRPADTFDGRKQWKGGDERGGPIERTQSLRRRASRCRGERTSHR